MPSVGTSIDLPPSTPSKLNGATSTLPNLSASTSTIPSLNIPPSSQATSQQQPPAPPEVEHTIERLTSNRNVKGVMICARDGPIIRQAGKEFEGEAGRRYAIAVKKIVEACVLGLADVDDSGDELKFMRMRTRRHELMISPDDRYILVVLHDPASQP